MGGGENLSEEVSSTLQVPCEDRLACKELETSTAGRGRAHRAASGFSSKKGPGGSEDEKRGQRYG